MQNNQKPTKPMPIWQILGIVIGSILTLAVGYLIIGSIKGDTRPILSVANEYKPDPAWRLRNENVTPPLIFCVGGVRCPSVHRSWKLGTIISKDNFRAVLDRSGWNFSITGDCEPPLNVSGETGITICEARGKKQGFDIAVSMSGAFNNPENAVITLSVE